jgi:hypothetical protein
MSIHSPDMSIHQLDGVLYWSQGIKDWTDTATPKNTITTACGQVLIDRLSDRLTD